MILLESKTNNPLFNIATEEYLLKNCDEDILYFYTNSPSVIIGKHQIHNQEVNIPFIIEHKIPAIRRISGGGSVFHDKGNLNYAIITSSNKAWVDFENFTKPLIQQLTKLGLSAELRSRSDIRIEGKKISGNASHIFKNRVLHHGSILFDTDLELLTNCLKNAPTKYKNKSVQSRRSIVTNISSHLKSPLNITDFQRRFTESLFVDGLINGEMELDKEAKNKIKKLIPEKYETIDWNVLYNANYQFQNTFFHNDRLEKISFKVKKGICLTEHTDTPLQKEIQRLTQNVPHETSEFAKALQQHFTEEEVLRYFF